MWTCSFFHPFIWTYVSGLTQLHDGPNSKCASNFMQSSKKKSVTETLAMIRQAFGKESPNSPRQKRHDRWREKSRACSSFYMTSIGLSTKNSSWHAKQSIPHTTVMFYSDCENVGRFWPKLWWQMNCLLHHDNAMSHTSFFTKEFFTKNNMILIPHPSYSRLGPLGLCFPDWR
jgi:hypothetical protein